MQKFTKERVVIYLALLLLLVLPNMGHASAPKISAGADVLMDVETGRIYYSKNADKRIEPASLTKLMTAVVAVENGCLDDVVTITGRSASISEGSIIDLRKDEKILLGELLKAALITSANDATVAIAEHVAGSHEGFIRMMNGKAAALGLFGTRYVNTNGYHHINHYTTATDLAVLTRYALGKAEINDLVQTQKATVYWVEPPARKMEIINSNRLLSMDYPGIDGVKTGTTPIAGNCLIASATRQGQRLIAVALNCYDRYKDCALLLDYGFETIKPVVVADAGTRVARVAVTGGLKAEVDAVVENTLVVKMDPDLLPQLEQRLELEKSVQAPLKQGHKLGVAIFILDGQEIGRAGLVAGSDVPRTGWHRQLWDAIRY
ncbi:MAG: D-alanyl-D-alanine carboxypeptidase [Peptococcaceae bacterium]|nr:D-alanyl-D-alanine carboxypeptidase [Peptococcaceae bacterium]